MDAPEDNNFRNIADKFEAYFSEKGFKTIEYGLEIRVVKMEHPDGRNVVLFTNHNGMDFIIKGYSFNYGN